MWTVSGCYALTPKDPHIEMQTSASSKKLFAVLGHWQTLLGYNVNLNELIVVGRGV